jgi:hypothetical protein
MDVKIPEKTIIKYLRDKDGSPRGVLIAVRLPDDVVSVNYSLCNKNDKFVKSMGIKIALGRALRNGDDSHKLPYCMAKEIEAFNLRVEKYFKVSRDRIYTW